MKRRSKVKVFLADTREAGCVSTTDYHWCENNELLKFGQFQGEGDISMCGIKSGKFTTHIIVRDLDVDREFLRELMIDGVEEMMECSVDGCGNYEIEVGFFHKFNIDDMVDELLSKANEFSDGQRVYCLGRTLNRVIE